MGFLIAPDYTKKMFRSDIHALLKHLRAGELGKAECVYDEMVDKIKAVAAQQLATKTAQIEEACAEISWISAGSFALQKPFLGRSDCLSDNLKIVGQTAFLSALAVAAIR